MLQSRTRSGAERPGKKNETKDGILKSRREEKKLVEKNDSCSSHFCNPPDRPASRRSNLPVRRLWNGQVLRVRRYGGGLPPSHDGGQQFGEILPIDSDAAGDIEFRWQGLRLPDRLVLLERKFVLAHSGRAADALPVLGGTGIRVELERPL